VKAIKYGNSNVPLKISYLQNQYTLLSYYPVRGVLDTNFINISFSSHVLLAHS